MQRGRASWFLAGSLVLLVPATACDDEPPASLDTYVALGDSFTSGGGLPEPVVGAVCQQSRLNYPNLVAEELGAELRDVSCGGAATQHATRPQPLGAGQAPPQLDALRPDTDLVTVGLGYNDSTFYLDLFYGCTAAAAADPEGRPCQDQREAAGVPDPATTAEAIGADVRATLEEVQDRAPSAEVLLVGYPQLIAAGSSCEAVPIAAGDLEFVRAGLESLDDALEQAAQDAGVTFVDVYSASAGHDMCAGKDAWVNGVTDQPGVAATYHPFAEGQRAVADLVLDALSD
jgi:lysophospholipase L1-like esterase